MIPEDPPEAYEDHFEPTLESAIELTERLGRDLDILRHSNKSLSDADKEEIWQMVLEMTRMSAALWRIEVLSRPD